jgi:hypothetical protein
MKKVYHVYPDIESWFNRLSNYRVMVNLTDEQIKQFEKAWFIVVENSYILRK